MIHQLITKIREHKIINKKTFSGNIDDLLSMRDEVEFDSEWMRVYSVLEEYSFDDETERDIDEVRQAAFETAYALSNSDEIAGFVSDDFEMICRAYVIGLEDKWMNALVRSYTEHRFPCCGKLEISESDADTVYDGLFRDEQQMWSAEGIKKNY